MNNKHPNYFNAIRLVYFAGAETGRSELPESNEALPLDTPSGVRIDRSPANAGKAETSERLPENEQHEYTHLRTEMAAAIEKILPLRGNANEIKTRVTAALSTVPITPAMRALLAAKRNTAQHIYTSDTGNSYVEVEIVPVNGTTANIEVSVYPKSSVPENKHDVKDTRTFLDFKAKAIQGLKGLTARREILQKGREIVNANPAIRAAVSEADARFPSNHLLSAKIANDEYVDIWLFRQTNGDVVVSILPYRAN